MSTDPHHSPYKSTGGLRRILNALRYSLQGLQAAIKYEAAFRQELALADALSVDTHPLLGRAKDLGSAAVMLLLLFTVAVWVGVAVSRFVMH